MVMYEGLPKGCARHLHQQILQEHNAFKRNDPTIRYNGASGNWQRSIKAGLKDALSRIDREGHGHCSLDWLLYEVAKYAVVDTYGSSWNTWKTARSIKKPEECRGTRPAFVVSHWRQSRHSRSGLSLEEGFLGYTRKILDKEIVYHAAESSSEDEPDSESNPGSGSAASGSGRLCSCKSSSKSDTATKTDSGSPKDETTPTTEGSTDTSEKNTEENGTSATDTLESFLDKAFRARLGHGGFHNLLTNGPSWSVAVPDTTQDSDLGDIDSIEVLLDIQVSLTTSESESKIMTLSVPGEDIRNSPSKSGEDGSLRVGWLKKMWRAWTLVQTWAAKRRGGTHLNLEDYLLEFVPGEAEVKAMLPGILSTLNDEN